MEAELRSDQKGAGEGSGLEGSVTAWEPAMAWDQQGPASYLPFSKPLKQL